MPYIPFVPVAPVQYAAGSVTGYTNGFFYQQGYNLELNAIAEEINGLQYQFSSLACKEPGSAAASLSSAAGSTGLLVKQLGSTNELLKTLNGNVGVLANKMEVVARGLASISSHAGSMSVTQKMAFADQAKNNKHSQLTTETAQEAAGLKKTVVTPEVTFETIKANLADYSMINGQVVAIGAIEEVGAKALAYGSTAVLGWVAESAIGNWFKTAYGDVKLYVEGFFPKEKVVAVAIDAAADQNIIMSGNATIPGNVG